MDSTDSQGISISAMDDTLTIPYTTKGEEKLEKLHYARCECYAGE